MSFIEVGPVTDQSECDGCDGSDFYKDDLLDKPHRFWTMMNDDLEFRHCSPMPLNVRRLFSDPNAAVRHQLVTARTYADRLDRVTSTVEHRFGWRKGDPHR